MLKFFGVTLDSFRLAGGVLLLMIGINIVNGSGGGTKGFFGLSYAMDGVIRNETLIETGVAAIFVNCFRSRAN